MSLNKYVQSLGISILICIASTPSSAQIIASVDSGVAPGTPNIIAGGFDVFNNDDDPEDQTDSQHGTVVARVIGSVNAGAQILPIKIVGPSFVGDSNVTNRGLAAANSRDDVRIVMKSTGATGSASEWLNIVNAGKIAIMRAGNESAANPNRDGAYAKDLGGRAIVVGGADSNGNIAPYSNRAGDSARVFIIAPGFNQFTNIQGTSFAAPRVAAAAALILQQNPNLSAQRVVEIILSTADDRGDPGIDSIYGNGLLNVEAATAPIGTSGGSSSGGGGIAVAAVVLGGAIAWAVLRNRDDDSLENTFITDIYDRGYIFDMTRRISTRSSGPSLASLLSEADLKTTAFSVDGGEDASSYAVLSSSLTEAEILNQRLDATQSVDDYDDELTKLTFYHQSVDGDSYRFSINNSLETGFGSLSLFQEQHDTLPQFEYTKSYTNPFLSYTDTGIASRVSYALSDEFGFNFGLSSNEEADKYGLESDSAIIEGTYRTGNTGLGLQLGSVREMGSLFGGASGGVLSVDESNTVSLGLSGTYAINDRFTLLGNYTEGYTQVDDWDQSYLQNFSSIRSNAYGLGLVGKGVFASTDQLGLGYSRPLKVKRGSADLIIPQGREDFGQPLYFNEERINLNPSASEQAFEAYYSFQPREDVEFTTYFLHQKNPDHNGDAGRENTVLATLKFSF